MIRKIEINGQVSATLKGNTLTFLKETIVELEDNVLKLSNRNNSITINGTTIVNGDSNIVIRNSTITINGQTINQIIESSKSEENDTDEGVLEYKIEDGVKDIKRLHLNGQSSIIIEDCSDMKKLMKVDINSQSKCHLENIDCEDLYITTNGQSSAMIINGIVEDIDLDTNGQSNIILNKVKYQTIYKDSSGQSNILVS